MKILKPYVVQSLESADPKSEAQSPSPMGHQDSLDSRSAFSRSKKERKRNEGKGDGEKNPTKRRGRETAVARKKMAKNANFSPRLTTKGCWCSAPRADKSFRLSSSFLA